MITSFSPQGLVLDLPPFAADPSAYTAMKNMRVAGVGVERALGQQAFAGVLQVFPKFAMAVPVGNAIYLLYMGGGGVWATDGTTHFDVTPTTGWIDFTTGTMTGQLLNGIAIFSQPGAAPWYWDGALVANSVKPLPGWLTGSVTANVIAAFGQHAFAGSVAGAAATDGGRLCWSDAAALGTVPASWVPTATNQAGELLLGTGAGRITAMKGLNASLMVYRRTGCFAVQYVGRPYIYTSRKLSADVGAASMNAVVEMRGQHVILAPGDIVLTDGVSVRSIGDERIKSSLFAQVSESGLRISHAYGVPGNSEVVFCMAVGTDTAANVAYVWNYERDKWSVRDLPDVAHSFYSYVPVVQPGAGGGDWAGDAQNWDADFSAWDSGASGGFAPRAVGVSVVNKQAWLLEYGDVAEGGGNIDASVERMSLAIGDGDQVCLVTRVMPRIAGSAGSIVNVSVGGQLAAGDPVAWSSPRQYTIGVSRAVDCLVVGRYVSVKFEAAVNASWSVAGFDVEWRMRGKQ